MKVSLSIVIANYNYGRYLKDAINSILSQCLPPVCVNGRNVLPVRGTDNAVELIICDAASTDDSVEIIQSYERYITWWCSEKDGGQSEAFNKGFCHSTGEWLTWLNADELLCPNVLYKFIQLVRQKKSAKWVTGNYMGFNDDNKKITSITWGPHVTAPFLKRSNAPFPVFGPTSFWRRDVYDKIGPIDESLHYAMDFEYWQRMIMAGIKTVRLNCFCWAFRVHNASKTAGVQCDALLEKRNKENEYIRKKTGYSFKFKFTNPYYILWLLWRVIDGSIFLKQIIKLFYIGRHVNNKNDVVFLEPYKLNNYQFYMQWFTKALKNEGIRGICGMRIPWNLKLLLGKLGFCFFLGRRRKKMIVCSGGRPEYFSWPWCYFYEIVPVVWDCWPKYWEYLKRFVIKMRVRTVFVTSSQFAKFIKEAVPGVNAVWLPEGIDKTGYKNGGILAKRTIDILELGRQYKPVHDAIVEYNFNKKIRHLYQSSSGGLLFANFEELTKAISDSKLVICYPRCDTHPSQAGHVETMTQRYWECMLSGALMVGRAPKELIEFLGYNPVIELGDNPALKIDEVLSNLEQYQSLADKNYNVALIRAPWSDRINIIKENLGI